MNIGMRIGKGRFLLEVEEIDWEDGLEGGGKE
jgi:hypothetical protein